MSDDVHQSVQSASVYVSSVSEADGYKSWKVAVGLPERFPKLEPIATPVSDQVESRYEQGSVFDERFYLGQAQNTRAQEILDSLANPYVAVVVPLGHGCTTLSQFVLAESSRHTLRFSRIPIRISMEDNLFADSPAGGKKPSRLGVPEWSDAKGWSNPERKRTSEDLATSAFAALVSPGHVEELIDNSLREGVVRSLVLRPWERVLGPALYGNLIGCSSQDQRELEAQRVRLAPFVGHSGIDWKALAPHAPLLSRPVTELLHDLNDRGTVRVSLQMDLSPSPYGRWQRLDKTRGGKGAKSSGLKEVACEQYRRVVELFGMALKNLNELGAPIIPRVVDVTLFMGPEALQTITSAWFEKPRIIEFKAYAPTDMFSILWRHYPYRFEATGGRTDLLSAVLDSKILARYRMVAPTIALSTTVALLEDYLRRALADYDTSTYQVGARFDEDEEMPPLDTPDEIATAVEQLRAKVNQVGFQLEAVEEAIGKHVTSEPGSKEAGT
jgi:hypothetical protein